MQSQPDGTRPEAEVEMVFTWRSTWGLNKESVKVETREPCFYAPGPCLPSFQRGDILTRVCADQTNFEIVAVKPNGVGGIDLQCVQLGLQNQGLA